MIAEMMPHSKFPTLSTPEEDLKALLAAMGIYDEPEGKCPGTLNDVYLRRIGEVKQECAYCSKGNACSTRHGSNVDLIRKNYGRCFTQHTNRELRSSCRSCPSAVRNECERIAPSLKVELVGDDEDIAEIDALIAGLSSPTKDVPHDPTPEPVTESAVASEAPKPALVSATTDCAPEASDLFSSQRFTTALQEALNEDADTLLVRLTRISAAICPTGAATFYGDELRAQFCAVSIALNIKGAMPVFRDVQHGRFPKGKPASDADALLSHDLRVVDLDWIAKHHHAGRSSAFKALLNEDGTLKLASAFDFASQPTSAEAKAGKLGLDTKAQAELGMLKTNTVRDRLKHLRESEGRDRTKIGDAITKGHGRKKGDPECLYQLYVLCVMNNWGDNDWSISAVLDSATRLHGYKETPARIRGDIDWLKPIMVKDKVKRP